MGWFTRTTITFLALCHLALVASVPSGVALTTKTGDADGSLWFFVAINVFMHLTVASTFGGRQLGIIPLAWIVPLFTIGMTTLSGLMIDQHWPPDLPLPWLVWPALFAPGLAALTYAWRIWLGQLQARRPAPPRTRRDEGVRTAADSAGERLGQADAVAVLFHQHDGDAERIRVVQLDRGGASTVRTAHQPPVRTVRLEKAQ
ncbi:hypothetical protein [Streptomyces sp. NPDC088270]|uniref:hypothetical protein n=1 Tax=unclassified Streptomyces TaxID=2593676 RepID=UPI003423DD01